MPNFKNFRAITLVIIILVIGILGVYSIKKGTKSSPQSITSVVQKDEPLDAGDTGESQGLRYVEYNKTVYSTNAAKRRVLYFYADWCPTCRPADANFKANIDVIPADVVVIRVNYNDNDTDQDEKDLANRYGITYQHTFVQVDGDGNEITKWNGGQLNELLTNIK